MVRIRLRRIGLKGQPTYRIVAADKESPRDGRFLEILGFYNPRTQPATIHVKEDRAYHWMKNGALPTESVEKVFKSAGILDLEAELKIWISGAPVPVQKQFNKKLNVYEVQAVLAVHNPDVVRRAIATGSSPKTVSRS